jgi:hypothetical protein
MLIAFLYQLTALVMEAVNALYLIKNHVMTSGSAQERHLEDLVNGE